MTFLLIVIAVLVMAGGAAYATGRFKVGSKQAAAIPARRRPLGKREQQMYLRLREAVPEQVVLAQVAFSSLLMARDRALRHSFRGKVADFVVCSRNFEVIGIIQLSEDGQRGRKDADNDQDTLLTSSGYKVIRYAEVPDAFTLKEDIAKLPVPEAQKLAAVPKAKAAAKPAPDTLPALDL